jgi:geranylgeranyl diphosphate synthase type II
MSNSELDKFLKSVYGAVEHFVKNAFEPKPPYTRRLYDAMLYSLNAGGKKLRPALLMLGYDLGREMKKNNSPKKHPVLVYACATEFIHTYSLIHDDLPPMDNDMVRRGKPTNHIVFGEATALLAGDGLLTMAFKLFSQDNGDNIPAEVKLKTVEYIVDSVGPAGMVGGQFADISAVGENVIVTAEKASELEFIHTNKTAKFISACFSAGAMLAGADDSFTSKLADAGLKAGFAFQIVDDILDVVSTTDKLGKVVGGDLRLMKLTYPQLYGIEKSKEAAVSLCNEAKSILDDVSGNTDKIKMLIDHIYARLD